MHYANNSLHKKITNVCVLVWIFFSNSSEHDSSGSQCNFKSLRRSSYSIIGSGFYANKTIMPITGA